MRRRRRNYGVVVKRGNFELQKMYSNKIHRKGVRRETVMEFQPNSYFVGWGKIFEFRS
jgi:hypothetical protein